MHRRAYVPRRDQRRPCQCRLNSYGHRLSRHHLGGKPRTRPWARPLTGCPPGVTLDRPGRCCSNGWTSAGPGRTRFTTQRNGSPMRWRSSPVSLKDKHHGHPDPADDPKTRTSGQRTIRRHCRRRSGLATPISLTTRSTGFGITEVVVDLRPVRQPHVSRLVDVARAALADLVPGIEIQGLHGPDGTEKTGRTGARFDDADAIDGNPISGAPIRATVQDWEDLPPRWLRKDRP